MYNKIKFKLLINTKSSRRQLMNHRFHFVLNSDLKKKLILQSKENNISISELIRTILKKMNFLTEQIHFKLKPQFYKYLKVEADEDFIARIKLEDYFLITTLQNSLKTYSKAQILRFILELYFNMLEIHGNKALVSFLIALNNKWEEEKRSKKVWDKTHMCLFQTKPALNMYFSRYGELQKVLIL